MSKYKIRNYIQGNKKFASLILPAKIVFDIAYVLFYEKDDYVKQGSTLEKNYQTGYGYQRRLNQKRVDRIAKELRNDPNKLISPTSIILACNSEDFEKMTENNIEEIDFSVVEQPIFRIVDGQHRVKALEQAGWFDYNLNVIIFIVEKNNRYPEVKMFNDINKLAISVKTDIATLAEFSYAILEGRKIDDHDYVSVKSVMLLNDNKECVWSSAIRFDVYNPNEVGIIGFQSFLNEIKPIVKLFLQSYESENFAGLSRLSQLDRIAGLFNEEVLIPAWKIIKNKWPNCFHKRVSTINIFEDEMVTYFAEDYYIQKTVGAKAINNLIFDVFMEAGDSKLFVEKFQEIINKSELRDDDWKKGGKFTGISSFSGANYIKKLIQNN